MFLTIKLKTAESLVVAADIAGLLVSASGASVVAFFGKLILAVVLGFVALGFLLRITTLRQKIYTTELTLTRWTYIASAAVSVVEVSLLVEITNLPVRFYQPGFKMWHWALVDMALWAAFLVQLQMLRQVLKRS